MTQTHNLQIFKGHHSRNMQLDKGDYPEKLQIVSLCHNKAVFFCVFGSCFRMLAVILVSSVCFSFLKGEFEVVACECVQTGLWRDPCCSVPLHQCSEKHQIVWSLKQHVVADLHLDPGSNPWQISTQGQTMADQHLRPGSNPWQIYTSTQVRSTPQHRFKPRLMGQCTTIA